MKNAKEIKSLIGLKYIRKVFNMTMKELAEELKVSSNTINLWEKGTLQITEDRLNQLKNYFNLDKEYFFRNDYNDDEITLIKTKSLEKTINKTIPADMLKNNVIKSYSEKAQEYLKELDDSIMKIEEEIENVKKELINQIQNVSIDTLSEFNISNNNKQIIKLVGQLQILHNQKNTFISIFKFK
jgi:transcriptional regulator with XRE-family HTH domain